MNPPRFTPAAPPIVQLGTRTITDHGAEPRCSACGGWGPLDQETSLCRWCWRAGPWAAWWVGRARWVSIPELAPVADLSAAREAREVPRLTDASSAAGAALDVALEPPPKLGPPRKRP